MTGWYNELVKILEQQKALLCELYKIVSEERDAIVGLNALELEKIVRKKEETLMKLSLWDNERQKLLANCGLEGKSLKEIIELSTEEEITVKLKEFYSTMHVLLSGISEIQKINEQLIDRSIIHIGTALRFLESFGINPKQSFSKEA